MASALDRALARSSAAILGAGACRSSGAHAAEAVAGAAAFGVCGAPADMKHGRRGEHLGIGSLAVSER